MKKYLSICAFLLITLKGFSQQQPAIKWEKQFDTNNDGEVFYDLKPTGNKGYIAVGTDSASGYDRFYLLMKFFGYEGWIVKLDSAGNVQWRTKNNKPGFHHYQSVQPTVDGGYVAAGLSGTYNPLGDSSNFYMVKYSGNGTQLWEKTYAGSFTESANCIAGTGSWGFVLAGYTTSNDGDVSGNHYPGFADVWVIRTDGGGNLLWKKCYGGTRQDTAHSIIQTPDNGYLIAGTSTSSNGDLTGNNGKADGWLIRTDSLGNIQWQKNYGAEGDDGFRDVVLNADGTYTVTGYSHSSSLFSHPSAAQSSDVWVLKIAEGGAVIWSKVYGSSKDDAGLSIVTAEDNSCIISGYAEANDYDVNGKTGTAVYDAWIIKVSGTGDLVWQRCSGGANTEEIAMAVVYLGQGEFTIGGFKSGFPHEAPDGYVARHGNGNTIKGTLYLDKNANGIKDAGENFFNDARIKIVKGGIENAVQPVNGSFALTVDTGTYISSLVLSSPYYTAISSTDTSTFATYLNIDSISFAIEPIPGKRDLIIGAIPVTPARPGFDLDYFLYYKNAGTDTINNGQILLKKDGRLSVVTSTPAVNNSNGDTLKWNYTNLKPQDSVSIQVRLRVSAPPATNINDTLLSVAIINPVIGDLTPANDTSIIRQRVQGAVDPNDKAENLGGRISSRQVADSAFIDYIIRFQNTGTDTAFNVVVRDTLDQNLQWTSLEMIAASHPYGMQTSNQNNIAWYIDNILLPDSTRNERLSHGFIAYRIRPKTSLIEGNTIRNSASIYFDYNLPVKTNTQVTTVSNFVNDQVTAINSPSVNTSAMVLFPNPTGDQLWLRIKDRATGKGSLSVYDINGRLLIRKQLGVINLSDYTTSLELGSLAPGMYTIFLQAGKNLYSQKLVLR